MTHDNTHTWVSYEVRRADGKRLVFLASPATLDYQLAKADEKWPHHGPHRVFSRHITHRTVVHSSEYEEHSRDVQEEIAA